MMEPNENYIRSAYAHAKEVDDAISMNIDRLSKLSDSSGLVPKFVALFRLLKKESKLVIECLEKTSFINQEKRLEP